MYKYKQSKKESTSPVTGGKAYLTKARSIVCFIRECERKPAVECIKYSLQYLTRKKNVFF